MKVAHVCCVIPPHGGMGSVAYREVAGLRARGVEATLFTPEEMEGRSFVKSVPSVWRIGNAAWLKGIREIVKGFDVVHLHYPFYGTAEQVLLNAEDLPPVVVSYHMDATAPGWKGLMFSLHRMLVQPFLFRHVKKILIASYDYAASSSIKSLIDQLTELPFGVDLERYTPGPSVRARFAVPDDAPTILFVGGLDRAHAFKGVDILLAAVAELDVKTHLLIVGDGDLRASYEERARTLGIDRRTHFLGRLSAEGGSASGGEDDALVDAYRSADVFAFPSTNQAEAFGLVALEAQACGLPVVASDLPGLRTVVLRSETGLLVKPGSVAELAQALYRVLSDAAFRARLAEKTVAHARTFSWDSHLDGLQKVYKDVCAS